MGILIGAGKKAGVSHHRDKSVVVKHQNVSVTRLQEVSSAQYLTQGEILKVSLKQKSSGIFSAVASQENSIRIRVGKVIVMVYLENMAIILCVASSISDDSLPQHLLNMWRAKCLTTIYRGLGEQKIYLNM